MKVVKEVLLATFDDEVKELRAVLKKAVAVQPDFRLTPESRTVLDLVNHIVQIPRIDVDIYSGKLKNSEQTRSLEEELSQSTIEATLKIFDETCNYLHQFFASKEDEDLFAETIVPFYEKDSPPQAWVHFLPKITTHLVLHKGILWTYLKAAGVAVNMFTYYGVLGEESAD